MKPHQPAFFADWWPAVNRENDFNMDPRRAARQELHPERHLREYELQDSAVIWSLWVSIMNRPGEHLGTADTAIIRVRRRLLEAVKALRDHGTTPPGVDDAAVYTVRSCLTVLPPEAMADGAGRLAQRADAGAPQPGLHGSPPHPGAGRQPRVRRGPARPVAGRADRSPTCFQVDVAVVWDGEEQRLARDARGVE